VNGRYAIGTDSHISLNPIEDLRWLDYGQRLTTHKRNTFDDGAAALVHATFSAGRSAMGNSAKNYFEIGSALDAVVFDSRSPLFMQATPEHLLSAIIYTSSPVDIFGTLVDGKWIVKNHYHLHEGEIMRDFMRARKLS
jgi:formimidoylglutamate deiminase